ncbi:hypothetical protein [Aquimarina longa]|uniref:hypothetical protein n=1 Tax=Aquimarina longa TaxID=1080221 RepID=UPI0007863BA8|nr:hypothetical protein [Aquimarina longa]
MKINKLFHLAIVAVLFLTVSCSKDSVADNSPITQEANILEEFESESTNKRSIVFPDELESSNLLGKWNLSFASDLPLSDYPNATVSFSKNEFGLIVALSDDCQTLTGSVKLVKDTPSASGGKITIGLLRFSEFCNAGLANDISVADRYEIKGDRLALFRIVNGKSKGVVFRR